MNSQTHTRQEHEKRLEEAFGALGQVITDQGDQAIEQTKLLRALVDQIRNAAPAPPPHIEEIVCTESS